jgi:imidazolonepropionase-like amidohydrolase
MRGGAKIFHLSALHLEASRQLSAFKGPHVRPPLILLLYALLVPLAWAQPLVIKRVTVIDATGRPAQPDMTVTIDKDRIAAVSPWKKAKIAKGAQVVDGTGKFLIPGLWDMHVHGTKGDGAGQTYLLYLANGVLGVREMWGPPNANEWRAEHAASYKPAPSIFLGSPIVDGPKPSRPGFIAIANATQGREVVAQQKQAGADFIKVYSLLPRDAYFAIAAESRKLGIPFEGHVPRSVTAAEASDAGQKSIEHLTGVALGCSAQEAALFAEIQTTKDRYPVYARAYETYDEATAQSLYARFVRNGTWQCPTLTVMRPLSRSDGPQFANDDRLRYMTRSVRSSWDLQAKAQSAESRKDAEASWREYPKLVGGMCRAGIGILAGTDVLNPYVYPGFSLHDELALLVEAGLPPMAALQAATSNAARFMGQLDRRGTIETGKVADLVLLDKNPLSDIRNTRSIQAIVLNGKLMPRSTLDAMLVEAEALANK